MKGDLIVNIIHVEVTQIRELYIDGFPRGNFFKGLMVWKDLLPMFPLYQEGLYSGVVLEDWIRMW